MSDPLLVVHVQVHVKAEGVEAFLRATLLNAENSLREPGVVRLNLVRDALDPTRFVLLEAYRDPAAAASHKETSHYLAWRDEVAPLMAEPRISRKYESLFPGIERW